MKDKNSKIASTSIPAGTYRERTESEKQAFALRAKETKMSASKIADSTFCKINYYHPLLKKKFPGNSKMWTVDKYYPYAKCGPLFIDEPRLDYRVQESKNKLAEFEKAGIKYLILKNGVEPLNEVEGLDL